MFCILALFLFAPGCDTPNTKNTASESTGSRIVSTVPSITEILFDIGIGDRLVGDSKFTIFPPKAAKVEKIGGLYDINLEKVVSLKPDLVVTLQENNILRDRLAAFDIKTISVDHRSIGGVLESYEIIGKALGQDVFEMAKQQQLVLREKIESFTEKYRDAPKVRVLLCVDRSRGTGRLQNLYVAGTNPYYEDVIRLAGGANVATETGMPFPNLDAEGVIHLAPEVIVELFTGEGTVSASLMSEDDRNRLDKNALADWQKLDAQVPAVRNGRIFVITEDFATIPGPRIPMLIARLAEILDRCRSTDGRK